MEFIPSSLPIEKEYPKLVRDRIPEILEKKGLKSKIQIAKSEEEYLAYLLKKIVEEAVEVNHSTEKGNLDEELADILELINAILKVKNWTMDDILAIQKQKREKNGGFDKKLIMMEYPTE